MGEHEGPGRFWTFLADNGVPLVLALIAFGGSFDHWVHLAASHGQAGVLAPAIAVSVDLGVYMAARERQRDARIGRKRKGWASWPTLVMCAGIALTLAGNVAGAQIDAWGFIVALVPGAFLLLAISLMERRAAEDGRRHLAAEARRQAAEAAERQRQLDLAEERERQLEAERQAEEARQRRAERQAELARRSAAIEGTVTSGVNGSVNSGATRLALAAGASAGGDGSQPDGNLSASKVMRAFWDREVAAGRMPTGADLMRAAGLDPMAGSLGRTNAGKWRRETEEAAG